MTKFRVKAKVDGSAAIRTEIRAETEERVREMAPEIVAKQAQMRGHDVDKAYVSVETVEEL